MHRPPFASEVLGRAFRFADQLLDARRCSDRVLLAGCDRGLPWPLFFTWEQPVESDGTDWRLFGLDHLGWFELAVVGRDFPHPLWALIPVLAADAVVVDLRTGDLTDRDLLLQ